MSATKNRKLDWRQDNKRGRGRRGWDSGKWRWIGGERLSRLWTPEPQDKAVCRCQETTSNNDDGTTGRLRVVVIIVLLSFYYGFFYLWTNNSIRGVFVCWSVCLSVMTRLKSVKTCIHDVAVMIVYGPISTQDDHILIGSLGHLLRSFVRTTHFTHSLRSSALLRSLHSRARSLTPLTPSWDG